MSCLENAALAFTQFSREDWTVEDQYPIFELTHTNGTVLRVEAPSGKGIFQVSLQHPTLDCNRTPHGVIDHTPVLNISFLPLGSVLRIAPKKVKATANEALDALYAAFGAPALQAIQQRRLQLTLSAKAWIINKLDRRNIGWHFNFETGLIYGPQTSLMIDPALADRLRQELRYARYFKGNEMKPLQQLVLTPASSLHDWVEIAQAVENAGPDFAPVNLQEEDC